MNTIQSILSGALALIILAALIGFFATFGLTIIGVFAALAIGSLAVNKFSSLKHQQRINAELKIT